MYDEELEKKKTKGDSVWTESSGVPVPQEPDMGSSPAPKKPVRKARTTAVKKPRGKK